MKKEDVLGAIAYLLILAIAITFGLSVLREHSTNSGLESGYYILFVLIAIVVGIVFNGFMFELAHLLGAKIGGYIVTSFNVLGLCWYKDNNNKIKFKFKSFDGLTGETKIIPNEKSKKPSNPSPYLLFGTLFYGVEIVLAVIFFSFVKDLKDNLVLVNAGYFVLTVAVLGGMIYLYNILPFHLDATTDGYRLTMVSNPKNKIAFNELLRVQNEIEKGNMNVEIKTFTEITNFTADLNLNKVYTLLDKKEYDEAEVLLDDIIKNKENIGEKVLLRARAQKIYINIMNKTLDDAKKYYDECVPIQERRNISNDVSMPSIRAYLLMSGLLDKSKSECLIALNNVYKALKHVPTNRKEIEISLFNEALQKVIDVHPSWGLDGYLLVINKK